MQIGCSSHLSHKCPADLSPGYIKMESRLSGSVSPGLGGGDGAADKLSRSEEAEEKRLERKTSKPYSKFSGVFPAKLGARVILLGGGVTEGHQTID